MKKISVDKFTEMFNGKKILEAGYRNKNVECYFEKGKIDIERFGFSIESPTRTLFATSVGDIKKITKKK